MDFALPAMTSALPLLVPLIVIDRPRSVSSLYPLIKIRSVVEELLSRAPRTGSKLQQPIFVDQFDRLALHVVLKVHRALNSHGNEIMRTTPLGGDINKLLAQNLGVVGARSELRQPRQGLGIIGLWATGHPALASAFGAINRLG